MKLPRSTKRRIAMRLELFAFELGFITAMLAVRYGLKRPPNSH